MMRKIVIIGGVAGGASAAARLRRLNEEDQITLLEKGPYVSFANCGLPYYIGDEIKDRNKLLIQTPELMKGRMNLDVRVNTEAVNVDHESKQVEIRDVVSGELTHLDYDVLIISTGAKPIIVPMEGKDQSHVFTLRNIPDMDKIKAYVNDNNVKTATVVGGGFIGLEMAENLHALGIQVSLFERGPQVMPSIDEEMAAMVHSHMLDKGVDLRLLESVTAIGKHTVTTSNDEVINADMVILAIGVLPEASLVKGIVELGVKDAIKTNDTFETSVKDIYAIGDVAEVTHKISEQDVHIPLAWIANRQGRLLADHLNGKVIEPLKPIGTAIAKVFDLSVASVGLNERALKDLGKTYHVLHTSGQSHAAYYPGATPMTIKTIFAEDGTIYGAQIVGRKGVDKRIDLIASAMTFNQKVTDLQRIEVAYAPPFSSAKDPVNIIGYAAENVLSDGMKLVQVTDVHDFKGELIDVREQVEFEVGHIEGAKHIPLGQLRERLDEIDSTKEVLIYCQVGQRGYNAQRILENAGIHAKNLDGGYKLYQQVYGVRKEVKPSVKVEDNTAKISTPNNVTKRFVEASGLQCPGPLLKVKENIDQMQDGDVLEIHVTDFGFCTDIEAWAKAMGHTVLRNETKQDRVEVEIQKGLHPGNKVPFNALNDANGYQMVENKNGATMVVFSGDLDKALASFIIATGAASYGKEVTMFFTFWGLNIIKKPGVTIKKEGLDQAFSKMMPSHAGKLPISKMNMAGMGARMIKHVMNKKKVDSLEVMIEKAQSMGVKMIACTMSMDIMAVTKDEIIDGVDFAGVGAYIGDTEKSNLNLFI